MKQFKTESKRILDLMINSIYTNKEIFLRELISNASDAIDKLKFLSLTDKKVISNFEINIKLDKENKTLEISDDGVGMTQEELEKNLGTIAESGTLAFKKDSEKKTDNELIGQFGVGFYSAFMVADNIKVYSKSYKGDKAYLWESNGADGYDIKETEKDGVGTTIILKLKEDTEDFKYSEFLDEYKISYLIKRYSDYIRYPIKMEMTHTKVKEGSDKDKPEYEDVKEIEKLNSMIPLWKKQKSEVKDEDLNDFYKNEFHDFNNPVKSVYAKIEGTVTYDTLLFFPEKAPFDYYTKDYKKGLKLYCNGVLIMDNCEELLPDYLGFVKGIVDSSDLSLNISREILQQSKQVKVIAQTLEKRILSELKKMLEAEREKYEKVFEAFGLRIKFGAYEGFGMNKDKLKDLILFYSEKKDKLVSLNEYVTDMQENQKEIYYACGENYEQIKRLPQLGKAVDSGYDVLLFKDDIDEFVVKVLDSYNDKKFKSVAETNFAENNEVEKKELEDKKEEYKDVLEFIKGELKDKVKDVRLSLNLKDYPVCFSTEGGISIEMEKVLNAMPNSDGKVKAEKILEINAKHKVSEKLKELFNGDKETLKKYAVVLYEQARLIENLPVEDVTAFIGAISDIL